MALIVNEVVSNSYKHAFNKQPETAEISFFLESQGKKVLLTIKDNGSGFKEKTTSPDSLGMEIISGLVEQLNGKYSYKSAGNRGSVFSLEFDNPLK